MPLSIPVLTTSLGARKPDRTGKVLAYAKPILLLTDEFSVSSAEIFAALFQDSKRGPVFGWRTAGAGAMNGAWIHALLKGDLLGDRAHWHSPPCLAGFDRSPFVLQRYHKPRIIESDWYDFTREQLVPMSGRVRLCPYYFVVGEGDAARAQLGGVLATICPADKKIIHGMRDAILAPCST